MSTPSRFRIFHLSYLSRPARDRVVYRTIYRQKVRRILELGIATGRRALRMIEVASCHTETKNIRFTGVDLFEDRSAADGPGTTLKSAYRQLKATGARIRLIPGDPAAALAQTANGLGQFDLVVVSAGQNARNLSRAWFYLPRLLHPGSEVLLERVLPNGQVGLRPAERMEVEALAAAATFRRAA